MDYFKVVQDGRLVDIEEREKTQAPPSDHDNPCGMENDNNDNL